MADSCSIIQSERLIMSLKRVISCLIVIILIISSLCIEANAARKASPFSKVQKAVAAAKQSESVPEKEDDKLAANSDSKSDADEPADEVSQKEDDKGNNIDDDKEVNDDTDEDYISPIDFEKYWETNDDVYAWISIPGADIEYPVLQSKKGVSDEYYLKHTWDKKSSKYGAIYTQRAYNSKSFSDIVTVIYGHRMNNGSMFGTLQKLYSDEKTFKKYDEIVIYLPEKELHYKVFAALPYSDAHILYNYDFSKLVDSESFFKTVFGATGIGVNLNQDNYSKGDGGIVILSTCLKGNNKKRYLVLAQQTD